MWYRALSITMVLILLAGIGISSHSVLATDDDGLSYADFYMPVSVEGYLSFVFDPAEGEMCNVALNGTTLISDVSLPPVNMLTKTSLWGGGMDVYNGSFTTSAYSIRYQGLGSPLIMIRALERMKCEVEPAADMKVLSDKSLLISAGGHSVLLVTDGKMSGDGEVSMDKNGFLMMRFYESENGQSAGEMAMDSLSQEMSLANAISLSRMGAEIDVKDGNWSSIYYDSVHVEALSLMENRWSFRISSESHEGKCVVFRLDGVNDNVSVLVDGVAVEKGSYYDSLFSTEDSVVWNATEDSGSTHVYVYIPSFSGHEVTIVQNASSSTGTSGGSAASSSSSFVPVLLAVFISAGALFLMVRRKKGGV